MRPRARGLYYAIDYESYARLADEPGRFHAQWRRQNPCDGISPAGMSLEEYRFGGTNRSGEGDDVILEADGWGHYVGCHLDIQNLTRYASTAYWYQAEPHKPFPPLPPVEARLPRPDE